MERRKRLLVIGMLIAGTCLALFVTSATLAYPIKWEPPISPGLYLSVSPSLVPASGFWNLTARYFPTGGSAGTLVDATIWIAMTFKGGSQLVVSKVLSGGLGEVAVLPGTAGVVFSAIYLNSSESVSLHTSQVMPSYVAGLYVIASTSSCSGLVYLASVSSKTARFGRDRFLFAFPPIVAVSPLVAYESEYWATWNRTGWFPSAFLGIPVMAFALAYLAVILASYAASRLAHSHSGSLPREGSAPIVDP